MPEATQGHPGENQLGTKGYGGPGGCQFEHEGVMDICCEEG